MKSKTWNWGVRLLGIVTVGFFVSFGVALCQERIYEVPQTQFPTPIDVSWGLKPWTDDDRVLVKARRDIDLLSASGKLTKSRWASFYVAALNDPQANLTQFQWAYATYKAVNVGIAFDDQNALLFKIQTQLEKIGSSNSYEWTRMRFLILMTRGFTDFEYRPIAERLLKRIPRDYPVKYFYTVILAGKPDMRTKALQEAQQTVKWWPQKPNSYMLLAQVHKNSWMFGGPSGDYDKAIAAYRKAAQMAPPNSAIRRDANASVGRLKKIKQIRQTRQKERRG